jgi:meiotic recombination protein DMC1
MATRKKLADVKGLSEAKVEKVQAEARKLQGATGASLPIGGWTTGTDALAFRQRGVLKITSGSAALDAVLGGGFETRAITELYGEFRTGKTQLCTTLCVACQLPSSQGGGAGKAAYIDTEGSFRPERVIPIAERWGLDAQAVLDNIVVARAFSHEHQTDLLVSLAAKMTEEPFRLLIVDSVCALFRTDFVGRGELAERQQKLGQFLAALKRLAECYGVAVVLTNQVMATPEGGGLSFVTDPKKPIGGHVLAHASTVRVFLRKGKGEQRLAKIVDHPSMPEAEASFALSNCGVTEFAD